MSEPTWRPVASVATFTLMTASFVVATTLTTAANAIILQYTAPIWVFLLGRIFLGERPHWQDALVLLAAMIGVGIVFLGAGPGGSALGMVIAVGSGVAFGCLTVTLRGLRCVPPLLVTWTNCAGSAVILLPAVLLWSTVWVTPAQLALLLLLGLVQFSLPYVLYTWALRRVEAYRASLIILLEAILNPAWTYLAVKEPVAPATLVGGSVILLSIAAWLLLTWRRRAQPARA